MTAVPFQHAFDLCAMHEVALLCDMIPVSYASQQLKFNGHMRFDC